MHLMRCLAFIEATIPLTIVAEHIRGTENVVADALSRNKLDMAHFLMQGSETEPMDVPKDLIELRTKEER